MQEARQLNVSPILSKAIMYLVLLSSKDRDDKDRQIEVITGKIAEIEKKLGIRIPIQLKKTAAGYYSGDLNRIVGSLLIAKGARSRSPIELTDYGVRVLTEKLKNCLNEGGDDVEKIISEAAEILDFDYEKYFS